MAEVKTISIQAVDEPWALLRPVREHTLEFAELVSSIRDHGLLKNIIVRPSPRDPERYELVDGLHRYRACQRLHKQTIACLVGSYTDDEVLQVQIAANANHIETSPVEFAKQMKRILGRYEDIGQTLSQAAIAKMVGKSKSWVSARLGLTELPDYQQRALTEGKIKLGHAAELTRIKNPVYRAELFTYALEHGVRETQLEAGRLLRNVIATRTEERRTNYIRLVPRYRSMDDALTELDTLQNVAGIILRDELKTATEGAKAALEWILGLDEKTRKLSATKWHDRMTREQQRDVLARQRYQELEELEKLREKRKKGVQNPPQTPIT